MYTRVHPHVHGACLACTQVSRRVLVMEYVDGTPLNRLSKVTEARLLSPPLPVSHVLSPPDIFSRPSKVMEARGIAPGSPESKLAGRRILAQLTEAFGRMMLGAGFIHGDPHPGNIFVQV